MQTWIERERDKQLSRTPPVWHNEQWWKENETIWATHFTHVSLSDPKLLAYCQTEEKGERGIYTPIKPGKYLTKYFASVLTAKQIAFYAAWQAKGLPPSESATTFLLATTPEDICDVYTRGPRSCMDGENFNDRPTMPVRVYGAGDLAIAYMTGETKRPGVDVVSRCLVWPEKKVAGRVYPTPGCWQSDGYDSDAQGNAYYNALWSALKDAGYKFLHEGVSFDGARITKIKGRHGDYVMPYLDNDYNVDDHGDYFVMVASDDGEYQCCRIDGTCEQREPDEPEYDYSCDRCGDGINNEWDTYEVYTSRRHSETWCQHCCDNHAFACEGYNRFYACDSVDEVSVSDRHYCEYYADENFYQSDDSGDWFDPDDNDKIEMADGEVWAASEFADHGFICAITGQNLHTKEHHRQYPEIAADCEDEDIAIWLKKQDELPIDDARKILMEV